jgi:TatA/E family protein of Tat protein translocase
MFGHLPELIIILGIGLIVFGPEKLPEVAASAGKMVREFRDLVDTAMNPVDTHVPEDFSQYYYESLARAGEDPAVEDEVEHEGFYEVLSEDEPEESEALTVEPVMETDEVLSSRPEATEDTPVEQVPPHET